MMVALRIMVLPYYCIALLQPHATLLSWGAFAATHHAMQACLAKPEWAARMGMPSQFSQPTPSPAEDISSSSSASDDAALLLFLGRRYAKMKRREAAISCLRLALQVNRELEEAQKALKELESKVDK